MKELISWKIKQQKISRLKAISVNIENSKDNVKHMDDMRRSDMCLIRVPGARKGDGVEAVFLLLNFYKSKIQ